MDFDETWQNDGDGSGKSDPIKFLAQSLQEPQDKGLILTFFSVRNTAHRFDHYCFMDFPSPSDNKLAAMPPSDK